MDSLAEEKLKDFERVMRQILDATYEVEAVGYTTTIAEIQWYAFALFQNWEKRKIKG
jgi:hypothetical protein